MKRKLLYISLAALVLIIVALFVFYKPKKEFDTKVTFSYKEKRPYGTYLCYNTLRAFYKTNDIKVEKQAPESWMSFDSVYTNKTLLFILTKQFNPNDYELNKLFDFVSKGNYVFISSLTFNEASQKFFEFNNNDFINEISFNKNSTLSKKVFLKQPFYITKDSVFVNPGFSNTTSFENYDSSRFSILGIADNGKPNLLRAKVNNGTFCISNNPFLFTNYFILSNNNQSYYQKVLSAIPDSVKHIVWDDYYMYRKEDYDESKEGSLLRVLFQFDSFTYAFWMAIILFALYLIIYIKIKQRFVYKIEPNKNDSLYFAQTIGRLYFEKGNHANLTRKMSSYFLEYVRSKYLINTSNLNNEFIEKLSAKSGYNFDLTQDLITAINNVNNQESISQDQLNEYYLLLQKFYKHNT